MKLILLELIFLMPVLAWSNVDEHLETVLAVTQCRASCLDEFSHLIRNEENCRKNSDCAMCWEMCEMMNEELELWLPLCLVPDICRPGCQLACNFKKNESTASLSTLIVRSVYEPHTDRVNVEWVPNQDLQSASAILYSVLLKDGNHKWYQIAQTTSHIVHIKRGLFSWNTSIRVLAANATHHVSDSETSYLNSYINDISIQSFSTNPRNIWKPQLQTLVKSETSAGLQATVVWPVKLHKNGSVQYEVSWSVIDDPMEITGHLYTSNNLAVLTLWPDSLYSVQINCFSLNKELYTQSEPLIIDTRSTHVIKEITKETCNTGEQIAIYAFAFISAFFITLTVIILALVLRRKGQHLMEEKDVIKEKTRNTTITPKIIKSPLPQIDSTPKEKKEVNQMDIKSSIFHII